MSDLIYKQDAKDAVDMALDTIDHVPEWVYDILLNSLDKVPSAEPEHLVKESGDLVKDLVNDCINRQDAVKTMYDLCEDIDQESLHIDVIVDALENLPSAESEIIHCKNCKHRDSNDCPMCYEEWIEIDEGDGYFDTDDIIHDRTTDEGFCHCAELRGEQDGNK